MNDTDGVAKLDALHEVLGGYGRVLTAYSGGVDSTVVAVVARRVLGKRDAPAAIGDSPSLPRRELTEALRLAERFDLDLRVVQPGEQDDADYVRNDAERCYHCKTNLYATLGPLAAELGIVRIANGTNTDDLSDDHRPGLRAAGEAAVVSPLAEAGLSKADVRAVAAVVGLPNADKPAAACLASRVAYGTPVTPEVLAQVERAEAALEDLGFTGLRVRHHGTVARIELPGDQIDRLLGDGARHAAVDAVKSAGYTYVALDLEGFRSGSGNAVLTIEQRASGGHER